MARDNRVRLSDEEVAKVEEAAEVAFGEGAAADLPYGRVIGYVVEDWLDENGQGTHE